MTEIKAASIATGAVIQGALASALQEAISLVIPIGVILPYASTMVPTGWRRCDGQGLLRTAYPELFVVLGTQHGAGDGVTTFQIPDMRGRSPVGEDDIGGSAASTPRLDQATIEAGFGGMSGATVTASAVHGAATTGARVVNYIIKVDNTIEVPSYPVAP